jgi:hypothetical protein
LREPHKKFQNSTTLFRKRGAQVRPPAPHMVLLLASVSANTCCEVDAIGATMRYACVCRANLRIQFTLRSLDFKLLNVS